MKSREGCVRVEAVQGKLLTLGESFVLKVRLKTDEMGRIRLSPFYSCLTPLSFSYQSPNVVACSTDLIKPLLVASAK